MSKKFITIIHFFKTPAPRQPEPRYARESGRWGEAEKEKGPVDLFPAEPTDEPFMARRP